MAGRGTEAKKYGVKSSAEERERLEAAIDLGKRSANLITKARILQTPCTHARDATAGKSMQRFAVRRRIGEPQRTADQERQRRQLERRNAARNGRHQRKRRLQRNGAEADQSGDGRGSGARGRRSCPPRHRARPRRATGGKNAAAQTRRNIQAATAEATRRGAKRTLSSRTRFITPGTTTRRPCRKAA